MHTTPINAQEAVIDVADVGVRLEELTAAPTLSSEHARECHELLALVAQTTRIDSCEFFTPKLYRYDSLPQRLDGIVDETEVTFFGVAYTAITTVAG